MKSFSRRKVEKSPNLLILMMDDSTTFQGGWIQYRIRERLENELALTYLPRGQSMLMMKCVAKQILGNWLDLFLTYLEIFLDIEVIMEAQLTELKHYGIIPFKSSKERQLIKLHECRTLMMKFVIIGKTMTSNEETVFWKSSVVLFEQVENNLMVNKLGYGLENSCSREQIQQTTGKGDYESGVLG